METTPAHNVLASLTLNATDLLQLEKDLQASAVSILQSAPAAGMTTIQMLESPEYRANRELFGKVWEALYA